MTIKDNILSIWELLLIGNVGFETKTINGVMWYLSSMLSCMFILYPLLKKYKYNYIYIF